jgi:hypothetical protein
MTFEAKTSVRKPIFENFNKDCFISFIFCRFYLTDFLYNTTLSAPLVISKILFIYKSLTITLIIFLSLNGSIINNS